MRRGEGLKWALAAVVCAAVGVAIDLGTDAIIVTQFGAQLAAFVAVVIVWEGVAEEAGVRRRRRAHAQWPNVKYVDGASFGPDDYLLVHHTPPVGAKEFYELPMDLVDRVSDRLPDEGSVADAIEVLLARDELAALPERREP